MCFTHVGGPATFANNWEPWISILRLKCTFRQTYKSPTCNTLMGQSFCFCGNSTYRSSSNITTAVQYEAFIDKYSFYSFQKLTLKGPLNFHKFEKTEEKKSWSSSCCSNTTTTTTTTITVFLSYTVLYAYVYSVYNFVYSCVYYNYTNGYTIQYS